LSLDGLGIIGDGVVVVALVAVGDAAVDVGQARFSRLSRPAAMMCCNPDAEVRVVAFQSPVICPRRADGPRSSQGCE